MFLQVERLNSVTRTPQEKFMNCINGRTSTKAGMAAFALTMLILFTLAGATLPLQAQTDGAGVQAPAVTHNTWTSGAAMPTARFGAFAGAIGKNIYVVGGGTNAQYQATAVNEIYNTKTNKWTTGAPDPTARELGASGVVNGILYVIGGSTAANGALNLVEAYDPVSNTWTTKAPMPTARNSVPAVVDKDVIYVIGGYDPDTGVFLATVESYNTTADAWTEESPLLISKAWEAVGLLGTTVVAADGQTSGGSVTGDNEGYNARKNTWAKLTADPTPRLETCFSAIKGQLYVAGGWNGSLLSVNEAYSSKTKSWTTLAVMPDAIATPGSATAGGRLYCFGGADNGNLNNVFNYVQIYQP
jgi:N-acetylneuraminic acid mutarotase